MTDEARSSLHDLLQRARDGDGRAREQLFEKCRAYVRVVARAEVESWLQAKVDPSDLVQQTMLEVHRGFDQFRGMSEGEYLAWVRRILTRNATDYVRRYGGTGKRQVSREIRWQASAGDDSRTGNREPSDSLETPSELVMRHEDELQVAEALTRLPPDYREVILLRNLERLSFNEVAERMDRSRPAVQMLWMRALRKLEEILTS